MVIWSAPENKKLLFWSWRSSLAEICHGLLVVVAMAVVAGVVVEVKFVVHLQQMPLEPTLDIVEARA